MIDKYRYTLIALVFAGACLFAAFALNFDLFEHVVASLKSAERFELDEFIIPALALVIALLTDGVRKNTGIKIEAEKVKIYKAMVFSVHHIMNNFVNQMQLFKMEADDTPGFDRRVLELYDGVIADATRQITALSSVTKLDENAIKKSVAPKSRIGASV